MRASATAFGVVEREPEDADVIVDALFGSGFRGRLEGAAEALVARANASLPRSWHSTCRAAWTAPAGAWRVTPSRPHSHSRSTAARSAPRSSPGAATQAR